MLIIVTAISYHNNYVNFMIVEPWDLGWVNKERHRIIVNKFVIYNIIIVIKIQNWWSNLLYILQTKFVQMIQ